jgi:hypothetical protein
MITRLLALGLGSLMIVACESEPEPEIVVVEPPEKDEVSYDNIDANEGVEEWDVDGDRLLDRQEFVSLVAVSWQDWDTDRNRVLSDDEFQSGWTGAGFSDAEGAFELVDTDDDAEVSAEEWSESSPWSEFDGDTSGTLEPQEFDYY